MLAVGATGMADTIKLNVVVLFDVLAEVPVTVMRYVPAAVPEVVVMVSTLEEVGLEGVLVNDERVAPAGKPETVRLTGWVEPESKVLVTVFEPELPAWTEMLPELERE